MTDLTIIYLTANEVPLIFDQHIQRHLLLAANDLPIISVSKKPVTIGKNIISDLPRSHISIYKEALIGVKAADTKYIAIAEDDVLYSPEHFKKRPSRPDIFAYNIACWSIYTWSDPAIYSYSGRRNHGMLICERDLYIQAFEERFTKYTDESKINNAIWAEPGKYERQLGVTVHPTELFYTDPACVMFTHPKGLSYTTLGMKKRLAPIRAYDIPYWGRAAEIVKLYE